MGQEDRKFKASFIDIRNLRPAWDRYMRPQLKIKGVKLFICVLQEGLVVLFCFSFIKKSFAGSGVQAFNSISQQAESTRSL